MEIFSRRSTAIEIMDDLACRGAVVDQTLRELEFINRWLGGNAVTMNGVKVLIGNRDEFSLADLGCGGGDMLKLIADWGRGKNMKMNLVGIDANPHIIDFAKKNCIDYPEISFEVLDIFSPGFETQKFDVVTGTLFYHHFSSESLIEFFSKLHRQVSIGFIINDIHRHWLAYHSIRLLTRTFSKSAMVKFDAPLSVLRAFKKKELIDIFSRAGIKTFSISWKWAFRWQVVFRAGT